MLGQITIILRLLDKNEFGKNVGSEIFFPKYFWAEKKIWIRNILLVKKCCI